MGATWLSGMLLIRSCTEGLEDGQTLVEGITCLMYWLTTSGEETVPPVICSANSKVREESRFRIAPLYRYRGPRLNNVSLPQHTTHMT